MIPPEFARGCEDLLDRLAGDDPAMRRKMSATLEDLFTETHWSTLEPAALAQLLFDGICLNGLSDWQLLAGAVGPLYRHAMQVLVPEERMNLLTAAKQSLQRGELSTNALWHFLLNDDDMGVVSTAALDLSMIPRAAEDDPLSGPRHVALTLETVMGNAQGAILGGLVALGDERVNELLRESRWLLSDNDIGVAARCQTGMSTVAALEFWLEWLEQLADAGLTESGLFGKVASALVWLTQARRTDEFVDIVRNFGYPHQAGEAVQPMFVRGRYSIHQIAQRYGARLYALEAAEAPPKLLSDVLCRFGLEPAAAHADRATMQ